MRRKYTTIGIPTDLYERINKYIEENSDLGYRTATEFIKEAIRSHLKEK